MQMDILTVSGIASTLGVSLQTVRKHIRDVPSLTIGRTRVYDAGRLQEITTRILMDSRAQGMAGASKHEVRERRRRALQLRAESNLPYADIARLTGYKTESGAWRAIHAERRQQLRIQP